MIGVSLLTEGEHRVACEWFERTQEAEPEYSEAYAGMAQCHTYLMEYDRASADISKACELDPDNEAYRDLKGEIDMLSAHVIGLPRISSEEIRSIFRTGDWLLFSVYKGPERGIYDLGPVVIQYGKGVEKLLHESLLLPIRERIRLDNMFCSDPHDGVRAMFWKGSDEKKIPPLPFTLKTLLGNDEKSLALGQWGSLGNDIRKTRRNPVTRVFSDMLRERGLSMKTLNELGKLCRDLSLERNGAAHISFYSRDEVMEKRGEMVKIINDIIGIVSRSGGDS
jgi:tetratricopeptide (TPR) repeat protein